MPARQKVPPPMDVHEVLPQKHSVAFWVAIGLGGYLLAVGIFAALYFSFRDDSQSNGGFGARADQSDLVVAIKAYRVQGHMMETPFFEVKDDWCFRYETDGMMTGIFVTRDDGSERTYLPNRSSGTIKIMPGGRYKICLGIHSGDARLAVFQENPISLKEIPKTAWIESQDVDGPPADDGMLELLEAEAM